MTKTNRRKARDMAFKYVFQYDFLGTDIYEFIDIQLAEEDFCEADIKYIKSTVAGVIENIIAIDEIINTYSKGWKNTRLSKVVLNAMRLCIYEMNYIDDIPDTVAINECIEIVKNYDMPEAAAYANGVLGAYQKRGE